MRTGNCHSSRSRGSFRPQLEQLEERWCPSVTVSTVPIFNGNLLKITGDSAADTVNVSDLGNGHMDVTDGDGNALGSADGVTRVKIDTKGGADVVHYTLVNQLTNSQAILVNLGSGDTNEATFDFSPGISDANLLLSVEGASGADAISATLGSLTAAHVGVFMYGGGGNDNLSVTAGGANIDADSSLLVRLDGAWGDDGIVTTFSGQILGGLFVSADGGRGVDTITSDITADPGSTGRLLATANGGQGTDNVTLNVHDNSGDSGPSTLERVHAVIFNLDNVDTLVNTDNVDVITRLPHRHGHGRGRGFI
jgi:hypothetical protein